MDRPLSFPEQVTILGAGPASHDLRLTALARAPRLVCADGGANRLGDATPDAIIGDCDSLEDLDAWRRRLGPRLMHIPEQDTTDFEKCLQRVDAPLIIGVGFLGGRLDHELAALHAIVADPRPIVLLGEDDAAVSAGVDLRLSMEVGDRISIFPLSPVVAVSGAGLRWPIAGLALTAGKRVGTSNEAAAGAVRMAFDRPGAIVAVAREKLDALIAAVAARPVSAPGGTS